MLLQPFEEMSSSMGLYTTNELTHPIIRFSFISGSVLSFVVVQVSLEPFEKRQTCELKELLATRLITTKYWSE